MVKVGSKKELEELSNQQFDGGAVGNATKESAKIDDIVSASGRTIRAIATPEIAFWVEPQTGRVIVVEGTEANESIWSGGL